MLSPAVAQEVRQYLRNGRKQLVTRPAADDHQRIIDYRTMTTLALREALADGATKAAVRYLYGEQNWAMRRMWARDARSAASLMPRGIQLSLLGPCSELDAASSPPPPTPSPQEQAMNGPNQRRLAPGRTHGQGE